MSEQFVGTPDPREEYAPLAQWLHELLRSAPSALATEQPEVGEDASRLGWDYHSAFYPQIPNFSLALLKREPETITRYAPLLFHLMSCRACHQAYLEIYDALRAALQVEIQPKTAPLRLPSSANLATTSPKHLVFLSQLLIGQARSVLRQAHREHADQDAWARSLLQQAMQFSRYIMQPTLRQRALRDLVEVASLAAPTQYTPPPGQASHTYAAFVGNNSGTRGRTLRRAEMMSRPNEGEASIDLRANALEGRITQSDDLLLLHLEGLEDHLRGKLLLISVPLGTLIEPVRWLGGNPYGIRSADPVSADGKITIALGRTELRLSHPEDRNLLETLFKKLDIYPL